MSEIMQIIARHFSETIHIRPEATDRILTKVREVLLKDLDLMERDIQNHDWTPLRAKMHKMKGELANIGLSEMAHSLQQLINAAPEQFSEECVPCIRNIRLELAPLLEK